MKNRLIVAIRLLLGRRVSVIDWVSINGTPDMNDLNLFLATFPNTPEAKLGHKTKKHQYIDFSIKMNNLDQTTSKPWG